MADFDHDGNIVRNAVSQSDALAGPRAWCHVMYALHALSALSGIMSPAFIITAFIFGWPSIIAVVINYVTRSNVENTWLESHWRWQLRTFWFAVLWLVIAWLLAATFIGVPLAFILVMVIGIWVTYRVIRGWLTLLDRRVMPVPTPDG